jgi:hypothetical protein
MPQTESSNITIRSAVPCDIPRLVEIAASAFNDHPFFLYLFPNRKEHPEAFKEYWHREFVANLSNTSSVLVVAEDPRAGKVLSFATWLVFMEGYSNPRAVSFGNPTILKGMRYKEIVYKTGLMFPRLSRLFKKEF